MSSKEIKRPFVKGRYAPEDIAKASFLYFLKAVLGYQIGPHHIAWAGLLTQHDRLLIEAARGHGKSWAISVGYTLWRIYQGKPIEVLLVSYSEDQVKDLMSKIDNQIDTNPFLAHLRPQPSQKWGAQLFEFSNGARIRGEGFGSSVRGAHPHFILVDDPLKDTGGMDPEDQFKYFSTALSGTAIRGTQIVVIGTPMDAGDLLEQLENNEAYKFAAFPAENEARTEALFPTLFTLEELRKKEKEVGSFAYAREFLLQRIDPKTQVFKDKFRTLQDESGLPGMVSIRTLVDPAISEKDRACDSAVVTVGLDSKNNLWELDTRLLHADDTNKLLWEIYKVALRFQRHQDYAVVWEEELFQKVLAFNWRQLLVERGHDIRTIGVVHEGTTGKHQRIMGLQTLWESKAIHLQPESPLIAQFRYYRPGMKGARIDGIDAFAWVKHPDVNHPYIKTQVFDGGMPEDILE